MSNPQPAETPAPAQLSEQDLDDVAGGIIAVAPAPAAVVSSQPVLPAIQRTLIGL